MGTKVSLYEKYRWLIAVTLLAFGTYAMFGLPTMKSVF